MRAHGAFNLTRLGWGLAVPVLFLSVVGLTAIHATDVDLSLADTADAARPVAPYAADAGWLQRIHDALGPLTSKQALFLLTGVALLLASLWPSYQKIGRYAYPCYAVVVVLLALLVVDRYVDLPLIPVRRHTRRWIQMAGFLTIQPSEFMKLALILALARYLRFRASYRRWPGLVPPLLLTLLPMVLILFQPDLGTLLMLLPVLFFMLFAAGARLRHLLIVVGLGTALLPVFYVYGMAEYQRKRIDVLFKQNVADERWHMNEGYQLRQSKITLGTGGLTGEGYGRGVFVRYDLLPDGHNDFIFAIVGNQWGLAGGALVLIAYGAIVVCGLEIATITNDPFGRLLAVGVIVMIVVQALLNIGMTIGLMPITGMTLPFVSAGGSSLWTNFLALGLLVNVAQRRPMLIGHPPFEHAND